MNDIPGTNPTSPSNSNHSFLKAIKEGLGIFWDFVQDRYIIRRAFVAMTIYITVMSYREAWIVIEKSLTDNNINVAAMIAAVLAPLSTLQGFVLKWYFVYSPDNSSALSANKVNRDAK